MTTFMQHKQMSHSTFFIKCLSSANPSSPHPMKLILSNQSRLDLAKEHLMFLLTVNLLTSEQLSGKLGINLSDIVKSFSDYQFMLSSLVLSVYVGMLISVTYFLSMIIWQEQYLKFYVQHNQINRQTVFKQYVRPNTEILLGMASYFSFIHYII